MEPSQQCQYAYSPGNHFKLSLESDSHALLTKPDFFFVDSIEEDEASLYDGDYRWLRLVDNRRFFLPNMERMYPLAYLRHMSVRQTMDWELVKPIFRVSLGKICAHEVFRSVMGGTY